MEPVHHIPYELEAIKPSYKLDARAETGESPPFVYKPDSPLSLVRLYDQTSLADFEHYNLGLSFFDFDEKTVRVSLQEIRLEPGAALKKYPNLFLPEKTVILHVVLWTSDINGDHYYYDAHSFEGVVKQSRDQRKQVRFHDDTIEFKYQTGARSSRPVMWGMNVRVACETPHSDSRTTKAFQVVGNVGVLFSVSLSSVLHHRRNLSHLTLHDCFEETTPLDVKTPLEVLAEQHELRCTNLKVGCDDNTKNLHAWQNPELEAFLFSCCMRVANMSSADLPTQAEKDALMKKLYSDNVHIKSSQERGANGYKYLYKKCCQVGAARYGNQYQHSVPGVHMSTQEHYNLFQLDPSHCKAHPRVLLNILSMTANRCGVTREAFNNLCQTDPESIVQGLYKNMLVLTCNGSSRYEFDMDCRGQPGERFTNTWGLFDMLHRCGRNNSNAASDCEDYAYFMAKLHVAFSHVSDLIAEFSPMLKGTADLDYSALTQLQQVISPWTVLPMSCSTYDASAHGESQGGGSGYQTHTCAVLIPKGRLRDMLKHSHMEPGDLDAWDNSVKAGKPLSTILLEGTAIVSNGHDALIPRSSNPAQMHPADVEAKQFATPLGCDTTFPIALKDSHFYAFCNQMCVGGNTYLLHQRCPQGKTRMPDSCRNLTRFTRPSNQDKQVFGVTIENLVNGFDSTSNCDQCVWQPMYDRAPTKDEVAALKRLHTITNPAFQLGFGNQNCDCGAWGRSQASTGKMRIRATKLSQAAQRAVASQIPYGILRGQLPKRLCNVPANIEVEQLPICNGFNLTFYVGKSCLSNAACSQVKLEPGDFEQGGFATCPITHEEFEDPVIAADGVRYERSAIERWLRQDETRVPTIL